MATAGFRQWVVVATVGLAGCAAQTSYDYDDSSDAMPFTVKSTKASILAAVKNSFVPASIPSHEKLAASYAEQGRYADALLQWKILSTLRPDDSHYATRVRQTEEQIATLAAQHQRTGVSALDKSDFVTARHELLATLALDPSRVEVLDSLRRIEYDRVWRIQSAKLDKLKASEDRKTTNGGEQERSYLELGASMLREGDYTDAVREIQKYLNSYPGDTQAKKLISDAYAKLASQQRQQGMLHNALANIEQAKRFSADTGSSRKAELEIRNALADEYYEKGLRALRNDLKLAVESFEKALEYNPQQSKARAKLSEARRMQKKLDEIGK